MVWFRLQILSQYGEKKVLKPNFHDIPPTGYAENYGYKHDEIDAAFVSGMSEPAQFWSSSQHEYVMKQ